MSPAAAAWENLPLVVCRGTTAAEVGRSHGEQLSGRIGATLSFYYGLFEECGLSLDEVHRWGDQLREELPGAAPELAEEISGIATGAGRMEWELFALNARSELLAYAQHRRGEQPLAECTALYCPEGACLAQNWDWDARFDRLPVLLRLPRRGRSPQILTMTEPGIVAKVGVNDCGVGVCLNFLAGPAPAEAPVGLPLHCLLRAALGCTSLAQAEALLRSAPRHCSCHVLLADGGGCFRLMEFLGREVACAGSSGEAPVEGVEPPAVAPRVVVHTNHYLHPQFAVDSKDLAHTRERFARAVELAAKEEETHGAGGGAGADAVSLAKRILGDRGGYPRSILYDSAPGMSDSARLATMCTVIMELASRRMHITRGSAMDQSFVQVPVTEASL